MFESKNGVYLFNQQTKPDGLIRKRLNFFLHSPLTPSAGPPSSACHLGSGWDLQGSYIIHNKDLAVRNELTSLLMCKSSETALLTF